MSQSATRTTRNEATKRWKPPKMTPPAELTIGTAIRGSRERLRTVANRNAASSEHTLNPQTPEWNGNPCYAFGNKKKTTRYNPRTRMHSRKTLLWNMSFERSESCNFFPVTVPVRCRHCGMWKGWNAKCGVWISVDLWRSVECEVWIVECTVYSVKCVVESVKCRGRSAKCKV